jgi:hypothetical protein
MDKPDEYTPEAGRHPEVARGAVKTLELLGMDETLSTPEKRRLFFRELDDAGYKKYLGFINSVTQGKPIQYEFQDGRLPITGTPPLEDKEPLMNELFAAVRRIMSDKNLDDEVALEYAGLALAGGVLLTHPYEEGNGRTSRVSQYLITHGNQRGRDQFEADLFGIIAKDSLYAGDLRKMMRNAVPPSVVKELDEYNLDNLREEFESSSWPERAAMRVRTFARMMSGELAIHNKHPITRVSEEANGELLRHEYAPGDADLKEFYLQTYKGRSRIEDQGLLPEMGPS